mgnify:FL=1
MFLALADTGTSTSTLAPIITAMGSLVEVMGEVWDVMTSNPLLLVFLAASLFGVGIRIFRKVKSAARG